MNHDKMPEKDLALIALYHRFATEKPPKSLDDKVKLMAQEAVGKPLSSPTLFQRRKWYYPVSAAASILLVVSMGAYLIDNHPHLSLPLPTKPAPVLSDNNLAAIPPFEINEEAVKAPSSEPTPAITAKKESRTLAKPAFVKELQARSRTSIASKDSTTTNKLYSPQRSFEQKDLDELIKQFNAHIDENRWKQAQSLLKAFTQKYPDSHEHDDIKKLKKKLEFHFGSKAN